MITEAIVLAGGFGTRLQSVVSDVPKPMAPVAGKPFLDYLLAYLKHFGVRHVVLSTGYLGHQIADRYQDVFNGIRISYAVEKSPLGTGGGIRLAMQSCHSADVLVLNGDSFFDIDLECYARQYAAANASGALALRKVEQAGRYGTISVDQAQRITHFKEKDQIERPGLINGGVYILNRQVFLDGTPAGQAFSIERDFFETRLSELAFCGFEHQGYFIDIGIPDDYQKAQHDFTRFTY